MKRTAFQTYSEYTEAQTETNRRKLNRVWVSHEELQRIGKDIRAHTPVLKEGICHGVRGGFENSTLQELRGVPVFGTEISASGSSFANVIQHDFHEPKAERRATFDFVYCNAWDHDYDLGKCLAAWADSLKPNGLLYLEWTREHAWRGERRGFLQIGVSGITVGLQQAV